MRSCAAGCRKPPSVDLCRDAGVMSPRLHRLGGPVSTDSSSPARRHIALPLAILGLTLFGRAQASAAAPSRADRIWARGELAHAGGLEIVAADRGSGLITVRVAPSVRAAPPAGRVLLSGPGYRITAAGSSSAGPAGASGHAVAGARIRSGAPLERRKHPIVCQGPRLLHLDSRNLEFDGDAVIAEQGCELLITNSRIVADKGFAVTARDASVHIDNSTISGSEGAVSASAAAQVYARSSTFKGLIRRLDSAAFHDLGANAGD